MEMNPELPGAAQKLTSTEPSQHHAAQEQLVAARGSSRAVLETLESFQSFRAFPGQLQRGWRFLKPLRALFRGCAGEIGCF